MAASQRGLRGNVFLEVWPCGWGGFWVVGEEGHSLSPSFIPSWETVPSRSSGTKQSLSHCVTQCRARLDRKCPL